MPSNNKVVRVGVGVALFDVLGRVLLQLRDDSKQWGFLGGGLEFGESLNECAVREVKEESGLIIDNNLEVLGVYSLPEHTIVEYPERTIQKIDVFVKGNIIGGTLTPNDESLDLCYFDLQDLPNNINKCAVLPLEDLKNNWSSHGYFRNIRILCK